MAKLVTLYKGEGGKFEEKYLVATDWSLINDKPTNFVPTSHPHVKDDITDFAHTHSISDITDTIIGKSVVQPLATFDFLSYDVPAGIYSFDSGDSTKKAPFTDGQILSLPYRIGAGGRFGAQMAFEDDHQDVRIRTHHNVNGWSEWNKFAMVSDIPTTYDWAKVNNRPNTLSDYGITDAYNVAQVNANFAAKATTLSGYGITNAYTKTEVNTHLANKADLVGGKVPANLLPSFVDDVLEFASFDNFPYDGESGKIYIDKDTNKTYRWSGSKYAVISETLALGETPYTAYHGSKGKANALAISNINTALAGKLGTGDTATDSFKLGGLLPSKYVLKTSYDNIINGTTQVGNTKKVAGKEVKYFTKIAFAGITPVAGVHYIVYEN